MQSPRIITGKYKGLKLKVPDSARPVTDRVKKSIFDILGAQVQGTEILDLFAGTGNLGIEALSEGAESGTFVEMDHEAAELLKANTARIEEPVKIIEINYRRFLKKNTQKFDLVFLDPPFDNIETVAWDLIKSSLKPTGVLIFKSDIEIGTKLARFFKILDKRKIGINYIYFLSADNA